MFNSVKIVVTIVQAIYEEYIPDPGLICNRNETKCLVSQHVLHNISKVHQKFSGLGSISYSSNFFTVRNTFGDINKNQTIYTFGFFLCITTIHKIQMI